MEEMMFRMPSTDVGIAMQLASRMGWTVDQPRSAVSRFIDACRKNASAMTDEEIQAEVNAVRYSA